MRRLTGVAAPERAVTSTYLYFASDQVLSAEPRLLLNAEDGLINNALWSSNTNPELAPAGTAPLGGHGIGAERAFRRRASARRQG